MPNVLAKARAATLALLAWLALAGCQSSMTALAPATGATLPSGTPVAFLPVQGPAPEMAQKFEAILQQEARKRGLEVTSPSGNTLRVRVFLDAYADAGGKSGFSWTLDASQDGKTITAKVRGAAESGAPASAPWSALDEAAMRQIAQLCLDDLARQLTGATQVAAVAGDEE